MHTDIEQQLLAKIMNRETLRKTVAQWKSEQKRVVFTNGCFDLVHIGHLTYMAKAAELGDKLIIGLNSDSSVRVLKGEGRPVNNEQSRAALLAALFFVDAVIIFEQETPRELIADLLPNILVKGSDYSIDKIVGAQEVLANGGEVKTINFVEGYSSTSIIERIRKQA